MTFTLAIVQMACSTNADDNLARAIGYIEQAAAQGAQVVCLPELFQHRYFPIIPMDDAAFALAEPVDGPCSQALAAAAKRCGVYVLGGSIYERAEENGKTVYYNTACSFAPDGHMIDAYRKCHIPQDPGFYEKDYFAEGDSLRVIETEFGKIGVMICFDQWFPEAARTAVLQGAQLLVYPTAIGMPDNIENITGDWRTMWQTAQRGHAAANNVYVAAINRVGDEPTPDGATTTFFGGSFIADYAGHATVHMDTQEGIALAVCDFSRQREVQEAWCFLTNRRPDLYAPLVAPKPV